MSRRKESSEEPEDGKPKEKKGGMLDKRLLAIVPESMKYVRANVAVQWISLVANIVMMYVICKLLSDLCYNKVSDSDILYTVAVCVIGLVIRAVCSVGSSKLSFYSSRAVKVKLRRMIYEKLLRLGTGYREKVNTAEVVQVSVEGVDQLETYFGAYVPQLFYAMIAPLTLFVVFLPINWPSALVLFICVPLIPIAIVAVQRWAKKLLSKYWGQYTNMGNTFLEDLQGLTTLKIYQSDEYKNKEMNEEAEKFRVVTMKVLTMQLNSITIMDFVAFGGAALGMILAVTQFDANHVDLAGCLMIILLAADFFLPMRTLGSFFHVAMNGMAAAGKIFRLLDLPEPDTKGNDYPSGSDIKVEDVTFSYSNGREVLHDIDMTFADKGFTSIVGESGSGKSTIASILVGRNTGYSGKVEVGDTDLSTVKEDGLLRNITYISHQSYLFKGTVRANLLMGRMDASEDDMWDALKRVNLDGFLRENEGLDTKLQEGAVNLSGGQRQRLALARALLHDSPVYIFDEATSNIDMESEAVIMDEIKRLVGTKTIILISHRLANVVGSDNIYVMEDGKVVESGKHDDLLSKHGAYEKLWTAQRNLETYGTRGVSQ